MKLFTLGLLAALAAPVWLPADSSLASLPVPKKDGGASVEAAFGDPALDPRVPQGTDDRERTRSTVVGGAGSDVSRWKTHGSFGHAQVSARNRRGHSKCLLPSEWGLSLCASHACTRFTRSGKNGRSIIGSSGDAGSGPECGSRLCDHVYDRMGPGARNRTFTDYEAGLASENLLLESVSLGLGAAVTGGIDAALVKKAIRFTGDEEVMSAGRGQRSQAVL